MAEVEIGIGKSGRRAYGFDDITIVPSRRTRDPEDVSIAWEIDAYRFELPLVASAMDGVVSPSVAIRLGQLGGPRRAQPRGPVDPVRRPGAAADRDRSAARGRRDRPGCRRSTASRSSPT
jgi:IMP dehydrogenase